MTASCIVTQLFKSNLYPLLVNANVLPPTHFLPTSYSLAFLLPFYSLPTPFLPPSHTLFQMEEDVGIDEDITVDMGKVRSVQAAPMGIDVSHNPSQGVTLPNVG